ncbi:MAG TPA: DHA2 family efflux MFS transporter permease subunit [Alphaproteobacteria bacterium]|nr:DHA2 family efflux MFS transporter permease subunit [Alphaproteobacteria bacterium]
MPASVKRNLAQLPPNRTMITITVMLATVMQVLDTTIANVALPHMQGSLGATQDQIDWVLTSYIVAAAIVTPTTGWLTTRFGRRRIFLVSLTGFTAASLLCGLANSLGEMVVFRLGQGLFGAALVPLSQATMLDTYPPSERGRAMAIWGMGVTVGPILGPTLGGYLTDYYNWRWCFYINLPVGILAVLGILAFVPDSVHKTGRRLDWLGFAFLSLGLASLQLFLDRGEQRGWLQSTEIKIEAVLTLFGLYMFVAESATSRRPFFDVRLFRDRTYILSVVLSAGVMIVLYGSMALTPQLLEGELNYPVFTAGLAMAPRGIGSIGSMWLVGRISHKVDPRWIIGTGLALTAVSLYQMSGWSLDVPESTVMWISTLQGFGFGFVTVPLTVVAFANLPADLRAEASGFYNLIRNVGGSVGISISAARLTELTQTFHAELGRFINPYRPMPMFGNLSGAASMVAVNGNITQQAAMVAYINVFLLMALLCTALILVLPLLRFSHALPPAESAVASE